MFASDSFRMEAVVGSFVREIRTAWKSSHPLKND
jgi:hypothetical protein